MLGTHYPTPPPRHLVRLFALPFDSLCTSLPPSQNRPSLDLPPTLVTG